MTDNPDHRDSSAGPGSFNEPQPSPPGGHGPTSPPPVDPTATACNQPTSSSDEPTGTLQGIREAPATGRRAALNTDRVVGMIVGVAAGDALGWPQEDRSQIIGGDKARDVAPRAQFRAWERNAGTRYGRYIDPVGAGEYSDDTQLMLAVARACQRPHWSAWLTEVELPLWSSYQRGGGGAVLAASRSWGDQNPPWKARDARDQARLSRYFNAGANGVAMRIAPHAIVCAHSPDKAELARRVIDDGITTHGHPRALVGAVIHAIALRYALTNEGTLGYGDVLDLVRHDHTWRDSAAFLRTLPRDWLHSQSDLTDGDTHQHPRDLWDRTCTEVDRLLDIATQGLQQGATANDQRTLADLGVFDKKQSGAGTVAAVAALYIAARTASRPTGGLLRSGFLRNADTDTLCSMTASLLGAVHGTTWLGELFATVQDRDHLIETARTLTRLAHENQVKQADDPGPDSVADQPQPETTPTTASIRRWVRAVSEGASPSEAPDGRRMTLMEVLPLRTRTRQHVARAMVLIGDGQTLFIDRVSKTPIPGLTQPTSDGNPSQAPSGDNEKPPRAPATSEPGKHNKPTQSQWEDVPIQATEPSLQASLEAVEVRVPDPQAAAQFFQKVFSLPLDYKPAGKIAVSSLFILVPARATGAPAPTDYPRSAEQPNAGSSRSSAPILVIRVSSFAAVVRAITGIDGAEARLTDDGSHLWVRGPGDLVVRAVEASS